MNYDSVRQPSHDSQPPTTMVTEPPTVQNVDPVMKLPGSQPTPWANQIPPMSIRTGPAYRASANMTRVWHGPGKCQCLAIRIMDGSELPAGKASRQFQAVVIETLT